MGTHNTQYIILFLRNLVGSVVQFLEVDRGECGDVRIKLCTACTLERRVQGEVKRVVFTSFRSMLVRIS